MAKRLIWADSLRGILIVLVVLGHAIQAQLGGECFTNHVWNYIYSFHMAAFMAISGWLSFRANRQPAIIGGGQIVNLLPSCSTTSNTILLVVIA